MKQTLKRLARFVAVLVMFPTIVAYRIHVSFSGRDLAISSWSQTVSMIPGTTGCYLRTAFYRAAIESCAPSVRIEFGTIFSKFKTVLEENVYIGPYCLIGSARIGADTLIGPGSHIPSGHHAHGTMALDVPIRLQPGEIRQVTIGRNCWIAANCVVMQDVGDSSIVAAGSIVTKPIPPAVLAAGVPAHVIRQRVPKPDSVDNSQ
jgi:acetyltransferase-like isoleucine patch superfamily enzyme